MTTSELIPTIGWPSACGGLGRGDSDPLQILAARISQAISPIGRGLYTQTTLTATGCVHQKLRQNPIWSTNQESQPNRCIGPPTFTSPSVEMQIPIQDGSWRHNR